LEIVLKILFTFVSFMLIFAVQTSVVMASTWKEDQVTADQYYETQEYKKAFKIYFKLAKMGVSHSQDRVSQMYSKGEGTKLSLTEAYAWSVLAAQRGASEMKTNRDGLLEQVSDKNKAEKKADKLMSKYGREALKKRADSKAKLKANTKGGGCTGSKLGCR
jgi:TPR repeat protein